MTKRKWTVLIAAVLAIGVVTGAVAAELVRDIKAQLRADFTVVIDGEERVFENVNGERVYPILYEGTTYLPLRAIGEIMGKKVYWYENDKLVELKDEKTTVTDADVIITDQENKQVKDNKDVVKDKNKVLVPPENAIGEEKAKEIALNKANLKAADVKYIKAEIDVENGVYVYEIEFRDGLKEYNADIKADDGSILGWDVDIDD